MPIKKLAQSERPGMTIGTLHKGGPKTASGGMGPDLDHWRFESKSPEVMAAFTAAYGNAPRKINVYLPFAEPDRDFSYWCEVWGKSGLIHRCDGENAVVWRDGSKMVSGSKPCPGGHAVKDGIEDPLNDSVGRLVVIIPELFEAGFFGFVTVGTRGKNDITHIVRVLNECFENRRDNLLGLKGIGFDLCRVEENISVPGYGKTAGDRTRANKWLIKLVPSIEWAQFQLELARRESIGLPTLPATQGLPAGESSPQLGPGDPGDPMDDFEIPAEWEAEGSKPDATQAPAQETSATHPSDPVAPSDKPKNAPEPVKYPKNVENALNMETPKGVKLRELTTDQLRQLIVSLETRPEYATKYASTIAACRVIINHFDPKNPVK